MSIAIDDRFVCRQVRCWRPQWRRLPSAACKRLSFLVNDFGKDGPTKDAKDLLDKYIAEWIKEQNISKWTVGKKEVKCELFLDFIVFDEHTCTAIGQRLLAGASRRKRLPRQDYQKK